MLSSIIVPVYNVKEYLVKCLNSIEQQTFDDYEVIVVDDGSTDGSGQLLDDYCKDKKRFRVFHKENGGLMSAWKFGVDKAQGEYVGFVDSDDFIEPEMYRLLSERIRRDEVDIAMCNHYYDSRATNGELVVHRNPIKDGLYKGKQLDTIRRLMLPGLGNDYISPSRVTKLLRKSLLIDNLKYCDNRISSAEDVNSMVPCMLSCKSLAYVDVPLYYYVQRNTSISYTFKSSLLDSYDILIHNLLKAIQDYQLRLDFQRRQLFNLYGLTWCIYVNGSKLSKSEKEKEIKRLYDKNRYMESIKMISMDNGATAVLYKLMMQYQKPKIYLKGTELLRLARKISGKIRRVKK